MAESYTLDHLANIATEVFDDERKRLRSSQSLEPIEPSFVRTSSNTMIVFTPSGFAEQRLRVVAHLWAPDRSDRAEAAWVARHAAKVLSSKFPASALLIAEVRCTQEADGLTYTLWATQV
jgi:hypothetical protein